jgi:hypothetical protein
LTATLASASVAVAHAPQLVTPDAIRIACAAWGFGRCGGAPAGRPRR